MKTKIRQNKKTLVLTALLIILSLTGCATQTLPTGQITGTEQKEPIKIGMMMPLTGDAASWGAEVKKGAELAFDSFIDKEIDGRKIEIIYEDDQCSGRVSVSAITKLIETDDVKLTGGSICSSVALSIAQIIESKKVLHLSAGASNPVLTTAGDYMFRLWPSDSYEAIIVADFIMTKSDIESKTKTAGILFINNDYGVGVKDAFIKRFNEKQGELVAVESFEPNAIDFKTQLIKIKTANPDAIFIISNPSEGAIILKQLRELRINQTIFVNGAVVESAGFLQNAGVLAEGIIYALPDLPVSENYTAAYKTKFGSEPGFLSSIGYDNMMLILYAIEYCNGDNPDCAKGYLYSIKSYDGASGKIAFDSNGDVIKDFMMKTVKNGTLVNLN